MLRRRVSTEVGTRFGGRRVAVSGCCRLRGLRGEMHLLLLELLALSAESLLRSATEPTSFAATTTEIAL